MSGDAEDLGLIFERARAELVAAGWTDHGEYFTHPDAERNPFHPHEEVDKWTMLTWSLRQALALKRAADAARADERERLGDSLECLARDEEGHAAAQDEDGCEGAVLRERARGVRLAIGHVRCVRFKRTGGSDER